MSAASILITDPLPVDAQPTGPLYYQGEHNICPSCGNAGFEVRRSTAECMHCGRPMALAHRDL